MPNLIPILGVALSLAVGSPQEAQSVITANNEFALDLYRQLGSGGGNLFYSPYSIHKVLAMTYAGARGDTAAEMARVLHLNLGQERQHQAYRELRQRLNASAVGTLASINPFRSQRDVQLYLSACLWAQRGYGFQKSYLSLVQDCYGAGLQEVDFRAGDAARKTINGWVDHQTNHKIPELFGRDALGINTRLVLTTAIYFKGDWVHAFPKNGTEDEPFWATAKEKVRVPMMHQAGTFGYCADSQVQVLRLPYVGQKLALLVVLPRKQDGLVDLEKMLTAEKLGTWLGQMREQQVDVSLPRFKLDEEFALKDALQALGMSKAFAPGKADFRGMNGGREELFIDSVVHKAFIELNEEGAEAAAATGVTMQALSASMGPGTPVIPVFRADHPFVFAIYDVRTGVVLFLGRVARP
jgi:serpin B